MTGSRVLKVGNITIACMSEETRNLLDMLCEEYRQTHRGQEISEINGYQALYWACRWSSLISKVKERRLVK